MKLAVAALAAITVFLPMAHAQYYKTLPEGVRTAVYRNVQTSEIDSTFNQSSSVSPISYTVEINAKTIESIEDPSISSLFQYVKSVYPDGFDQLSAGAFKISGAANVQVDGYGFGYGISDRVTAYGFLPMFKADVRMKYKRTKNNNFGDVADLYTTETGNDLAQGVGSVFDNTPDLLTGPTIQNIITESFGYKEIGDWSGQGPGDMEFGLMYNFLQQENYGLMVTGGAVAPTGREDDPNILQDIGFGDGQWDAFVEFGGGYMAGHSVIFNSFARYTHQFSAQKEMRIPSSSENSISEETGSFNEKRGNKLLLNVNSDYILNDWVNFNAAYIYESVGKTKYVSDFGQANDWLAQNTESVSKSARFKAAISSVNAFMKQEFLLPAQIKFYYQTTLEGVNTPKVDRYEFEFQMFF